jgi:hypothetical protein
MNKGEENIKRTFLDGEFHNSITVIDFMLFYMPLGNLCVQCSAVLWNIDEHRICFSANQHLGNAML